MHSRFNSPEDLDPLLERIGDAHCVLLGEASHGTSEYYTWRARISERLIQEKSFFFIAVEGGWPNRYVKGYRASGRSAREVLRVFQTWPTWMWANEEILEFAEWLRRHNDGLPEEERIGFYGLDVHSLWESMEAVVEYLTWPLCIANRENTSVCRLLQALQKSYVLVLYLTRRLPFGAGSAVGRDHRVVSIGHDSNLALSTEPDNLLEDLS